MRRTLTVAAAALVAASLLLPAAALAKKKKRRPTPPTTWSVPFTCGSNVDLLEGVVPGDHVFTAYVSNGAASAASLQLVVAITRPTGGAVAGPVSLPVQVELAAMEATQTTCADLLDGMFMYDDPPDTTTYVQGVLRITSASRLTVAAQQSVIGPAGDLAVVDVPVTTSTGVALDADPKVTICHAPPGNPANARTLSVGASAWPAHQAHGDTMGTCP